MDLASESLKYPLAKANHKEGSVYPGFYLVWVKFTVKYLKLFHHDTRRILQKITLLI